MLGAEEPQYNLITCLLNKRSTCSALLGACQDAELVQIAHDSLYFDSQDRNAGWEGAEVI